MRTVLDSTILRFRRRVLLQHALRSFQSATLVLAGITVFAVIALRLFDVAVVPGPLWLSALVLPLALGVVMAFRATPRPAAFAAHVDRRGEGMGLLLASLERDPGSWGEDVERRAQVADKALPRVRGGAAALTVFSSAVAVGLLGLLPEIEPSGAPRAGAPAIAQALEAAREELALVKELEILDEQEAAALEQRIEALDQRLVDQEAVGWADLDSLVDAIREANEDAARGHESVRARSAELATKLASQGADERDRRELQALAARAQDLGMLEGLPPDVRAALESLARRGGAADGEGAGAASGSAIDPASLDAERLRELARSLADRGKARLDHARQQVAGRVDTRALQQLLDQQGEGLGGSGDPMPAVGEGWNPAEGGSDDDAGSGMPGRGGVSRGRGDATLDHLGATEIDLTGMRAEQLPDGRVPPDQWDLAGIGRAEPEVAPERSRSGAPSAASGVPGAASGRRDLAPRHRAAVRRFFEGDGR